MWSSPELVAKVSAVAGVDLVPAFDYEIAHVNISINDKSESPATNEPAKAQDTAAFAWHYDSFPFVCVTMISDCAGMVGGETAMKMPSGEVMKVRGPTMVSISTLSRHMQTNTSHRELRLLCKVVTLSTQL